MITGVHHIGLRSSRLPATAKTLERLCGAPTREGPRLLFEGVGARIALEGATPGEPPRQVHEAGITHVCLQSRDGPKLRADLVAAGVEFHAEPAGLGTGFRYAYGAIPGGGVIESETSDKLPEEPSAWFSHIAFATPDLPRLSGFYADLLGLDAQEGQRLSGHPALDKVTGLNDVDLTSAWVNGLNLGLEFWQYFNPATALVGPRTGFAYIAFSVSDLAAATARASSLGASDLRDPDGNPFCFVREEGATDERD